MSQFKIGAILDSFVCPIPEAMRRAAAIGATGFQVYATHGDVSPEAMTAEKQQEFKSMCEANGLVVSALCGDYGKGFTDPEENPKLIEGSKRILYLAKELGTNIVTTHIGTVPEDTNCDTYKIMQEACHELAEYADSLDAHFAVETGPEVAERLCAFLDSLNSTGVSVNLDPANLIMSSQDDPVKAVHILKKYIVHTHAKDGLSLVGRKPEEFTDPNVMKGFEQHPTWVELPLGTGGVDWDNYLRALRDIGYTGFLTIERECGDDPSADIRMAADFLREKMAKL